MPPSTFTDLNRRAISLNCSCAAPPLCIALLGRASIVQYYSIYPADQCALAVRMTHLRLRLIGPWLLAGSVGTRVVCDHSLPPL